MLVKASIKDLDYVSRIGASEVDFLPGVNILVGSNGCGKSSLLEAILHEVDNQDTKVARLIRDPSVPIVRYSGETATVQLMQTAEQKTGSLTDRHVSHGQGLRYYLESLTNLEGEHIVIMDEPETALDFFTVSGLCKAIASKSDIQFLISTHHPLIMTMKNANFINMDRTNKRYPGDVLKRLKARLA